MSDARLAPMLGVSPRTPHSLLDGESPLDRMDTVVGMEEVKTMLTHVEHGMPV